MPKSYPSLARLRALRAVCDSGGFSAAANELLVTQSAVSSQIRQLEEEVGTLLIERIGKSIKPTPAGEMLLASTRNVFRELDDTLQRIAELQGEVTGQIVIGAGATATIYLLPEPLAHISRKYPKLSIKVVTGNSPDLIKELLAASIDIVICTAPVSDPHLAQEPFYEDHLVCIAPAKDKDLPATLEPPGLSGRKLVLYEHGGHIREAVDGWLGSKSDRAPEIIEIGNAEALKSFVQAGFGWSIVSELTVSNDAKRGAVKRLPLSPALSRQLITVWRKDRQTNPVISAVRAVISEYAQPH